MALSSQSVFSREEPLIARGRGGLVGAIASEPNARERWLRRPRAMIWTVRDAEPRAFRLSSRFTGAHWPRTAVDHKQHSSFSLG